MKKLIALLVLVAFASGLVFICADIAFAKEKPKEEAKAEESKKEEPRVVCKFKTKEEMQEFENLYVAKQASFGRMGVLQGYFALEQNNIQAIDKQIEEKFGFKMDMDKMYDLNRDTMEIREVGPVPQQTPPVPPATQ